MKKRIHSYIKTEQMQKQILTFVIMLIISTQTTIGQRVNMTNNSMIFAGHTAEVNDLDISKDGKYLVTASSDKQLIIWEATNPVPLKYLKGHNEKVNTVKFIRDGSMIISGGDDGQIIIWDSKTTDIIKRINKKTTGKYMARITELEISPDQTYFLSGHSDNSIRKWKLTNISGKTKFRIITGHSWTISDISIAPDNEYFISSSGNNEIKQWTKDGEFIRDIYGHIGWINSLDISRNGEFMVSASNDKQIIIRTAFNAKKQRTFYEDTSINVVRISPDMQYIASGNNNNKINLTELSSGAKYELSGHRDVINDIEFSSNGKFIYSASSDNTMRKWYIGDLRVKIYFAKEIQNELDTASIFKEQDEFETLAEYKERKKSWNKAKEKIYTKYRHKYEKMVKEKGEIAMRTKNNKTHNIKLRIDSISDYNPEIEDRYFTIRLKPTKNSDKYEEIRGPLYMPRDEARLFKKNNAYKKAVITGKAYITTKGDIYQVSNIIINHPYIKNKKYIFGKKPKKQK